MHVISRRVRNRRTTRQGVVHSTTDLFETQIAYVQGVPIVTPIRAIFDIAGRVHPAGSSEPSTAPGLGGW